MSGQRPADGPVIHLTLLGRLGNQMIEYMAALKLASLVPRSRISNVRIPEWNIAHPAIASDGPVLRIGPWERFDVATVASSLNTGEYRRLEWSGYGQRMANFLPPQCYARVFASPPAPDTAFDQRHLLCPVRAGDIVAGGYGDYPLTPVECYQEVVARTALLPVFMGETAPNAYTDRLRQAFPAAPFLASRGAMADFALIRQAKNIVVGVSTFVWLAAWLSHADQIFLTINGLFNPQQHPLVDLLPFDDPRYRFWLFPINYAAPLSAHADAHRRLMPYCRLMPAPALQRQFQNAPLTPPDLAAALAEFDEAWYLAAYPDVAAAVARGELGSGREHYQHFGRADHRQPFAFDAPWYAGRYPMAALDVAQGDHVDLVHHYLAVGKARGYRRGPG